MEAKSMYYDLNNYNENNVIHFESINYKKTKDSVIMVDAVNNEWGKLTTSQQNEYILKAQKGDKNALDFIIKGISNYIYKMANYYGINNGLEVEDLFQEGVLGAMKAVSVFKIEQNIKFLSYAGFYIRAYIINYTRNCGTTIRIPYYLLEKYFKIRDRLKEGIESASLSELLSEEELGENDYYRIYNIRHIFSIYGSGLKDRSCKHDDDSDYYTLLNQIECPNSDIFAKTLKLNLETDIRGVLLELLNTLSEREKSILEKRNGFKGNRIYTLKELAIEYEVSPERIRQIENKALQKLKKRIKGNKISSAEDYCM